MHPNNSINADGKERRSFVALLLPAGYARRWAFQLGFRDVEEGLG